MKHEALLSKEFLSGATFMLIAALALYFGRDLTIGTATRMGPGFFPLGLALCLMAIGLAAAVKGLLFGGELVERTTFRPFFVFLAVLCFAVLIGPFGLVAALTALIGIGSLSGMAIRPLQVLALIVLLCVFSWAVFVWGLNMPLAIWPF